MKTAVPLGISVPRLDLRRFGTVGPAWFTGIMGTGILAICATMAPIPVPFGRQAGIALWSADTLLFALFTAAWIANGIRSPKTLKAGLRDPVKAQVFGAPSMACFTIAVGFLKIGEAFLPMAICVAAAQTLFVVGVIGSIGSAFIVPYFMFTAHELTPESMTATWLLPVVPPIVASVPAALLSSSWPETIRGDMLAAAYALLGIGLILAAIIIVIFYGRLTIYKVPQGALVTSMWLIVGPLGQSIAGTIALGGAAETVWPAFGHGLALGALAYSVLAWGFAMYWLVMAIALTIRATSKAIPFTLGWWAFTFPVGVLTAGTDALFNQTRVHIFGAASIALLGLLAAMWSLVVTKTVRVAFSEIVVRGCSPSAKAAIFPASDSALPAN